jgi:hypothetical protein
MFDTVPSRYANARLVPALVLRPSGFLYNPRNAESYSLNPVAACLVEALLAGTAPDRIWQALVTRFEVSEPLAHRDALQFLATLHELKLLTLPPDRKSESEEAKDEETEAEAPARARRGRGRSQDARSHAR